MNNKPLLHTYIYILILIKICLIILMLRRASLEVQMKYSNKKDYSEKIENMKYLKNFIERIFLIGVYLLIMFLFNPFKKEAIVTDHHTRTLIFVTGIISIIHTVSKQ